MSCVGHGRLPSHTYGCVVSVWPQLLLSRHEFFQHHKLIRRRGLFRRHCGSLGIQLQSIRVWQRTAQCHSTLWRYYSIEKFISINRFKLQMDFIFLALGVVGLGFAYGGTASSGLLTLIFLIQICSNVRKCPWEWQRPLSWISKKKKKIPSTLLLFLDGWLLFVITHLCDYSFYADDHFVALTDVLSSPTGR